ncbi:MAG: geranylgeranyl reductase family protein [Promethearchaeota archaeon]
MNGDQEVIIIGAGPVGSCAALETSKNGFKTLVFEEHSQIGHPNHCSGLISSSGLNRIRLSLSDPFILNRISRALIYSPSYHKLEISRERDEMFVIDRRLIDQKLANLAMRKGVEYRLNHRVHQVKLKNRSSIDLQVRIGCDTSEIFKALVLINCEGQRGSIARKLGIKIPPRTFALPAAQYEVENGVFEKETVELYHGSKWAPGFFTWIIPKNESEAEVGVACKRIDGFSPLFFLNRFIKHHPIAKKRLKHTKVKKIRGGFVPAFGPAQQTLLGPILNAGDIAGQAKATTGGGFNIGCYCGRIAGITAVKFIQSSPRDLKILKQYELEWRTRFFKELWLMKHIRRSLGNVEDKVLDKGFKTLKQIGIEDYLRNGVDIDLHAVSILKKMINGHMIAFGLLNSFKILEAWVRSA